MFELLAGFKNAKHDYYALIRFLRHLFPAVHRHKNNATNVNALCQHYWVELSSSTLSQELVESTVKKSRPWWWMGRDWGGLVFYSFYLLLLPLLLLRGLPAESSLWIFYSYLHNGGGKFSFTSPARRRRLLLQSWRSGHVALLHQHTL